jgi:hypothetical protein
MTPLLSVNTLSTLIGCLKKIQTAPAVDFLRFLCCFQIGDTTEERTKKSEGRERKRKITVSKTNNDVKKYFFGSLTYKLGVRGSIFFKDHKKS